MQGLGIESQPAQAKLHKILSTSRVGQRWERMVRLHAHEVEALLAVYPDVRDDVRQALDLLAHAGPLDESTTRSVERVLDDLQRHASVDLQRDITQMREELATGRGRTLQEFLVD